ncbi:MAG: M3 family oligoendopeptidase [Planctomycetes bacterium]|nr:M3 family oligoendopeptidase [Planctomycetota bacterium]
MTVAALETLKPYQSRRFVPEAFDPGNWTHLEPLFKQLEERGRALADAAELERWVLDGSELDAAVQQETARRYIRMTCQTDDPATERAYLDFVEQVEPKLKPAWQRLAQLFLACPHRAGLPARRWEVFERDTRNEVDLFREANVPLETDEARLKQQYQKTMGAMTVLFRGEERTLQQMGKFLEDPDRALREEAFRMVVQRRLRDREEIETLFEKLLALRDRIAKNADCADYRAFAFRSRGRFDYTPAHCEAFHAAVEAHVVPLARQLQERRRKLLGVDRLMPWDLAVDPQNRPALRPFQDTETFVASTQAVFERIDPALGSDFQVLVDHGLLDLESRKGKAPGGYQYTLEEARLPFIFMNAVGLQRDVETLLHEGGHAFHALATRQEPLLAYRHAPLEFCEVASMAMELLGGPHLEAFYRPEDAARARRTHLEGIINLLPWIATIDAFQHWLYTHPGHKREERKAAWLSTLRRFGGTEDWSGFEAAESHLWHRQGHLFGSPFYYIEYGIAQLGALQVWRNSLSDLKGAIAKYRAALALGRSRPLPELFEAAGATFDFSARTVQPLTEALAAELARLESA